MINIKEEDDLLNDHDYIISIQSKKRFMNYGLSEYNNAEDHILHYKQLQNKLIESQEKIEDEFNFIETIANNNNPSKRKKGALFNAKEAKVKWNGRRRGMFFKFAFFKNLVF